MTYIADGASAAATQAAIDAHAAVVAQVFTQIHADPGNSQDVRDAALAAAETLAPASRPPVPTTAGAAAAWRARKFPDTTAPPELPWRERGGS